MAIHCRRSLVICSTFATFFMVASILESVCSSSLPNSSSITACSSSSIPIWRETVLSVPMESLITSSCSSCPTRMRCCVASVSSTNRLELASNTDEDEAPVGT
uniref:Putative secreted protein n=1 Tax=Anopheles darlingi TaxID=43151 RepID=A0A2M4DA02_ANODA